MVIKDLEHLGLAENTQFASRIKGGSVYDLQQQTAAANAAYAYQNAMFNALIQQANSSGKVGSPSFR